MDAGGAAGPLTSVLLVAVLLVGLPGPAAPDNILDIFRSSAQVKEKIVPEPRAEVAYDFVVVGAGSGGSAVANRLSERPDWRVLLLEAGGAEGFFSQVPVLVSFFQLSDLNYGYRVEPQRECCLGMRNRQCPWPRGKCLGGTSAINYMIHTRGAPFDYDRWEALGNPGWAYRDVLRYFKKSEKFMVPGIFNSTYHNSNGYICVEHVPYHTDLAKAFLKAGKEIGYDIVDYNGKDQIGFSYLQVNMEHGTRCSAAKAYLRVQRPNLDIVTAAQVTKVLIRDKKAYGVEYIKEGKVRTLLVSKEVILSAGTIDSAKILMLSGIGPRDHLEDLGIEVIQDAKVGYNLVEHVGFLGLTFIVNQTAGLSQKKLMKPNVVFEYLLQSKGLMTLPGGAEAISFMKTKYAKESRPDIELLFASGSLQSDGGLSLRRGLAITDELYNAVYRPIENEQTWSIWPIGQNPKSVGRITLRSKNPMDAPIIQPNFFSHPDDVEIILEGIKYAIDLSKTAAFAAYGTRLHTVKIPGCRKYVFNSDNYWRCAIKHLPSMMNHEIGTAKMGPRSDPDAVVDPRLRVHGIGSLRVIDASIMPTLPVGHVNAAIYMVGEKGADMIKEDWRNSEDKSYYFEN